MTQTLQPLDQQKAVELPSPGLYHGIDFSEYRAWPALSRSLIEWGMDSMAHMKGAVDGRIQSKESDALEFGRALHARLLEPMRFRAEWAVMDIQPDDPNKYKNFKLTKEYKAKAEQWGRDNPGCEPIQPDDAESIEGMARSIHSHAAVKLLRSSGGSEVSITWTDPSTHISLKSRLDKFIPEFGRRKIPTILDLKGVRAADDDSLSKQINELGWHRQASIYCRGIQELTGNEPDYLLIAVEKTYPYAVAVRRIGDLSLSVGQQQTTGILQRWAKAQETGIFPAFGDDIQSIDIPTWELKKWSGLN